MRHTIVALSILLAAGCSAVGPAVKALAGGKPAPAPQAEAKVYVVQNNAPVAPPAKPQSHKKAAAAGALVGAAAGGYACYERCGGGTRQRVVAGALVGAGIGAAAFWLADHL